MLIDNDHVVTFRYPRIKADSLQPLEDGPEAWYPPGHGDIYECLVKCGLVKKFLAQGKKYMFLSNIDNVGATVDLSILLLLC